MEKLITAWVEHCQSWGKVWFGTLFWGSVLGAAYLAWFPDGNSMAVHAVAATIGATIGIAAQRRGRWV